MSEKQINGNTNLIYDKDNMLKSLFELLKIKSVKTAPINDAPFGEGVKEALLYMLDLGTSLGFEVKNYDNYIGEIIWGNGEPFGILCHLDVVPEGDLSEWKTNPYIPEIIDGKLYARGALDDKSGAVSVLYAMKALKDANYIPKRQIRLILGCDEESGWGCIDHYKKVAQLPEEGISPDADFPVIYAEKGIMHVTYRFLKHPDIISVTGGERANVVCDKVEVKLKNSGLYNRYPHILKGDGVYCTLGVAAHGSTPEKGKNAMDEMFLFLSKLNLLDTDIYENLFKDKCGLTKLEDETGKLTFSPDIVRSDENYIYVTVDVRYPSTYEKQFIMDQLAKVGEYEIVNYQAPLYCGKDGLTKVLCDIYNEVSGKNLAPIAIGGGTYARALKRGVAFGPADGEEADSIHKPNEFVTLKTIDLMNEVYLKTLLKVCC